MALFSGPGRVPALCDRRTDQRYATIFRAARIVCGGREGLCLIRNISAGGAMARLYAPIAVGEEVAIELKAGPTIPGHIRWVRGGDAGIQFTEHIDVERLLAGAAQPPDGPVPRQPRLAVGAPALIRCGIVYRPVLVHDISQGGAKVDAAEWAAVDDPVVLRIAGLPILEGVVRWCDGRRAGVRFDRPLALETLARWAAEYPWTDRG